MFWKRKHRGERRTRRHQGAGSEDAEQLSVPGYGPPPVTRPLSGGPQPSPYGIRPDVDPGQWTDVPE
jgi:hypothetical protein